MPQRPRNVSNRKVVPGGGSGQRESGQAGRPGRPAGSRAVPAVLPSGAAGAVPGQGAHETPPPPVNASASGTSN